MFETLKDAITHYAKCIGCSLTEAKEDAERSIKLMMEQEKCSREFAEATWMEETEELNAEELDKIEQEAKKSGATKTEAGKGKRKKVERKPNEEKRELIQSLHDFLFELGGTSFVTIANPEREITFTIGDNSYSVTLTCHRKKGG